MPLRNAHRDSPCRSTRCAERKAGVNYSRREFVKQGASALIVGLTLKNSTLQIFAIEESTTRGGLPPARSVSPEELDSWLAISAEGKVTVYTGRVDLGTGVQAKGISRNVQ